MKPSVGPFQNTLTRAGDRDEYILVGGGLQNALIALALLERRPDTRLTLVEREPALGGNHTWCFHASDVPRSARGFLEPLVVKRWPAHDVMFPSHRRRMPDEYNALTSERLHREVSARILGAPHARILTANVRAVGSSSVTLDDGLELGAELVIDARGPAPAPLVNGRASLGGGYQKFVGLELRVDSGTAPELPILMDATVQQIDGFRFVYVLPWASDRVLVEDTYYSTNAALDLPVLRQRIFEYAAAAGLRVQGVLREESGVLPIPARLDLDTVPGNTVPRGSVRAGYAGGLFHPTTGYSLPVALRFALHIAGRPAADALGAEYACLMAEHQRQVRFCLRLNRLLFGGFAPEERYRVLERFYRLPLPTIRRFYALETHAADRARILCGRPPSGFSLRRLLSGGQPS